MELELWMQEKPGIVLPQVFESLAMMKAAGVQISMVDYMNLTARFRDCLVVWNQTEMRVRKEASK